MLKLLSIYSSSSSIFVNRLGLWVPDADFILRLNIVENVGVLIAQVCCAIVLELANLDWLFVFVLRLRP